MRSLLLSMALSLVSAQAFAHLKPADHFLDAMKFAVEHFNASHAKDLISWGPEHKFMHELLNEVGRQVPAVVELQEISREVQKRDLDPYASLKRDFYLFDPVANKSQFDEAADLKQAIMALGSGCPMDTEEVTKTSIVGPHSMVTKTLLTQFEFAAWGANQYCARPALAQKLVALGIGSITFFEDPKYLDGQKFNVLTRPAFNVWRDMEYARNQLLADPETRAFASLVHTINLDIELIGAKRSGIRLIGSSGSASFTDPVTLEYLYGWGDCTAGCIHNHIWTIEVTPTANAGGGYDFAVKVLSEGGDPLP